MESNKIVALWMLAYFLVGLCWTIVAGGGYYENPLRRGVFWPVYLLGWLVRNIKEAVKDAYHGR